MIVRMCGETSCAQGRSGGGKVQYFDGRGRSQGVGKFIQGDGTGDTIVWVRNVGPFGVNGKEDRGNAHGVPENDHGEESETIRR